MFLASNSADLCNTERVVVYWARAGWVCGADVGDLGVGCYEEEE